MVWWEIAESIDVSLSRSEGTSGTAAITGTAGASSTESAADSASEAEAIAFPPLPDLTPLPESLPELLAASRKAGITLQHVTSWRAVTAFARHHWLADAPADTTDLIGEYHALRHAVADQLELVDEAKAERAAWLKWATAAGVHSAILHARSYGAFAEAEAFIDANPGDAITGRRPEDAEIPELVSLADEILATTPRQGEAYYYLVSAAVTGAAASLARRADIAGKLSKWSARWAPKRSGLDDRKLLEAQLAHGRGELRKAARIAAGVAATPQSEPVTTTIEARQFLAFLSLEAGEEDEAIRQLRPIVQAGLDAGLTVAVLRSTRLLCALLNAHGHFAEAAEIARHALERAEGMPANPISMDIQLILARSLLDADAIEDALRYAEPVAHWSTFTSDEERTDAAFSIAAAAAGLANNPRHAAKLLVEHGEHLERIGDAKGASKAYRQAARSVIHIIDVVITETAAAADAADASLTIDRTLSEAEDLLLRSQKLITDDWSMADWHDDAAYIFYSAGRDELATDHVEAAAEGYLNSGDGEEAARALLAGVRYRLDADDPEGAEDYARRVEKLLPRATWDGHPVLDALDTILPQMPHDDQ
ncbi:MAG: hypothetical protein Q4E11_03215 [Corynebacterium sp.]|uniref:hypothetical protein n=1 Tax=Corynebacterium sp. TaxID=1720 RepID=UPI0026DD06D3|nr:hypothetical protein [Corynebacterium sp.]MDO5029578.1 hypothetical protein [Corynebacterium sp.]